MGKILKSVTITRVPFATMIEEFLVGVDKFVHPICDPHRLATSLVNCMLEKHITRKLSAFGINATSPLDFLVAYLIVGEHVSNGAPMPNNHHGDFCLELLDSNGMHLPGGRRRLDKETLDVMRLWDWDLDASDNLDQIEDQAAAILSSNEVDAFAMYLDELVPVKGFDYWDSYYDVGRTVLSYYGDYRLHKFDEIFLGKDGKYILGE